MPAGAQARGSHPLALWAAEASGARRLLELPDGFRGAWTAWGNRLFFIADAGDNAGLWVSDGTAAGTRAMD